jgi:integrase
MSVRRNTRGKWVTDVVYQFPNGRVQRVQKVSPVQTRRGAEEYERQVRAALLAGTYRREEETKPDREVPTFSAFSREFMQTYAAVNNKPSEIVSKKSLLKHHLVPSLGPMKLDQIGALEIERFKAHLVGEGLKPKSVNNSLAVLSKILHFAEEATIITKAPRVKFMEVTLPDFDFLDFEETTRILDAADQYEWAWFPMLHTALKTGLRFGELIELRWRDVDLVAGQIRVSRNCYKGHVGTPKGGKPRDVPLSPEAVRVLKAHRHLRGELVFCREDGGRIKDSTADDAIKRICLRAGLRRIGWHTCRHTFASHLVMRGAALKTVQELLGHQSMAMTLRYAHLTPTVRREAVELLDRTNATLTQPSAEAAAS